MTMIPALVQHALTVMRNSYPHNPNVGPILDEALRRIDAELGADPGTSADRHIAALEAKIVQLEARLVEAASNDREAFVSMLVRAGVDFSDGSGRRTKTPSKVTTLYGELDESVDFWHGGGIGGSTEGVISAQFQGGVLHGFWACD